MYVSTSKEMIGPTKMKLCNAAKIAYAISATSLLAGCGGGGTSTTDVTTPTTPAAVTRAYTSFDSIAATSTVNATVSGSGATEALTFSAPAFTLTGATTSNPVFSANGGIVRADGNAIGYCSAGTAASVGDTPRRVGLRIFMTSPTLVTDITEIRGKSFPMFDCTEDRTTFVFNANGTGTLTRPNVSPVVFPADVLSRALSASGFTDGAANTRFIPYKITTSGVTKYFVIVASIEANGSKYLTFSAEN